MFSGIIEKKGIIHSIEGNPRTQLNVWIETNLSDLQLGESIAINGVCLTVAEIRPNGHALFYISPETLNKTQLGSLSLNSTVNLERALRVSDRLSGHIVQGHVDGVGAITEIQKIADSHLVKVKIPRDLLKYCIQKGSITVNGISLTINHLDDVDSTVELMIIPHTWNVTTLGSNQINDAVNIEVDVLAKYMERLCQPLKNL